MAFFPGDPNIINSTTGVADNQKTKELMIYEIDGPRSVRAEFWPSSVKDSRETKYTTNTQVGDTDLIAFEGVGLRKVSMTLLLKDGMKPGGMYQTPYAYRAMLSLREMAVPTSETVGPTGVPEPSDLYLIAYETMKVKLVKVDFNVLGVDRNPIDNSYIPIWAEVDLEFIVTGGTGDASNAFQGFGYSTITPELPNFNN